MTLFYLSFADEAGFLGACHVEAPDFISAVTESHRLGCNGGGEVLGVELPARAVAVIPRSFWNRLLTKADLAELDRVGGGSGEIISPTTGRRERP